MERRDQKECAKAINAFANRVMRRLLASGDRSLTREDIVNELWIAWCLACDAYDPKSGVPFMAYFRNGMRQHINRYVEKNVTRRHDEVVAYSIDAPANEIDDESDFHSVIASNIETPDETVARQSQFDYAASRLSDRARIFVTILRDQPPALLEEVRRLGAKAEYARTKGVNMTVFNRLTASMVFDLMDANRNERVAITREVREIGELTART